MADTFKNAREALRWQKYQDQFAPKSGDQAPDFELIDVRDEATIRLRDFEGIRPVALIFGSFT